LIQAVYQTVREDHAVRASRILQILNNLTLTLTERETETKTEIERKIERETDREIERESRVWRERVINVYFDLLSISFTIAAHPPHPVTASNTHRRMSLTSRNTEVGSRVSMSMHPAGNHPNGSASTSLYFTVIVQLLLSLHAMQQQHVSSAGRSCVSQALVSERLIGLLSHHEEEVERVLQRAKTITAIERDRDREREREKEREGQGQQGSMKDQIQACLYAIEEYATSTPNVTEEEEGGRERENERVNERVHDQQENEIETKRSMEMEFVACW
jgi:hypothetical protein